MKTCVIIPAYNEAQTIPHLIRRIRAYIPDVLVINDGSTDNTEELAKKAGAIVLSFKDNVGKGRALKEGFDYALKNDYDVVITMDADGQHSPDDIQKIIDAAAPSEIGIVVGNRMAEPRNMPLLRFVTNLVMSFIISLICRQKIPDTQCGFRLIKQKVFKEFKLVSLNYEIESEMLLKASRTGFKIASIPIKSVYEGQVSLINPFLDTWRFLVMLARTL